MLTFSFAVNAIHMTCAMIMEQAAMRWWRASVLKLFGSKILLMWCVFLGDALRLLCRYAAYVMSSSFTLFLWNSKCVSCSFADL